MWSRRRAGGSSDADSTGRDPLAAFLRKSKKKTDSLTSLSASTISNQKSTSEDDFSGPHGITKFIGECDLPTDKGLFRLRSYQYQGMKIVDRNGEKVQEYVEMEPVIIYKGSLRGSDQAVVRVHDQCFTSEVMGSKRCDCKEQLDLALDYIQEHGGAIVYMPQEGRGIGLAYKVAAYQLQDGGLDTVDANRHLGFGDDERSYACIPYMLKDMGIRGIQLVTNNPMKIMQLSDLGVNIVGRRPSLVPANKFNEKYLRTKAQRMAHAIAFDDEEHAASFGPEVIVDGKRAKQGSQARFGAQSVASAISAMTQGRPVVLLAKEGAAEGGAKLCVAAAEAKTEGVALMMTHGDGVITAAMPQEVHASLVRETGPLRYTECGSPSGFSAADRTVTLKQLASPSARPHFFSAPGHVFPRAVSTSGGLRTKVEEAAVDLAGLAGLRQVVGVSDLVGADRLGLMSGAEAEAFAIANGLAVTSVEDVQLFRAAAQ